MNLKFSEEQEMLKTMARDFLTSKFPKKVVKEVEASEKGYSPEIWKEMAGLGWMGLVLPEKYGGANMSFLDMAILLEEMGRSCMPGPFFSTVILGGMTVLDAGSDEQKQAYLPGIAAGDTIFALALTEPEGRYDAAGINMPAKREGSDYVLNGTKVFVSDAQNADYILCAARTSAGGNPGEGITLFVIDAKSPGITITPHQTIANDKQCHVAFKQVRIPSKNILGQPDAGWPIINRTIERAAIARCCDMAGAMQQVQEMTIAYAKDRQQFGRPIGTFQIIQHYCADIATDTDGIKLSAYQAAWRLSAGLPCTQEAAIAKAWAGQASQRILALAHQIHGAIGVTMDHDLQYYTRRAKANEVTFGDVVYSREIVAREMGL